MIDTKSNIISSKFKTINNIITQNNIQSIIQYGLSDKNQIELFNTENKIFTGIDKNLSNVLKCNDLFKDDKTKHFIHSNNIKNNLNADLVLIYNVHKDLKDDTHKEFIQNLLNKSKRYVVIYEKCISEKYKHFLNYINNLPQWKFYEFVPNENLQIDNNFYVYEKIDNVIITMNLCNRKFINYTKPYMIEYSQKTNSKLIIINNKNIEHIDNYFKNFNNFKIGRNNNKSYLYKFLVIIYYSNFFNKILWLDDTCFIKSNCVNLFDMLSDNDIMAYNEGENLNLSSWKHCEKFIKKITKFTIDTNKYINSGIVLYSKKITEVLNVENITKYKELLNSPYPHQSFLNFIIQYSNIKLKVIPSSYNCMFMNCSYDNGRRIKAEEIGEEFVLSENNFIFHITGFYKNRLDVVKYISEILSNKKLSYNITDSNMNVKKIPVYLSLTSIFKNQNLLFQTLQSILAQSLMPDKIFLYLSEDKSFFDNGFKNKKLTNTKLINLLKNNNIIEIKWGKDIGPFGKLLPILKEKWNENCIIITVDDDTIYRDNLIYNLVNDYYKHKCVINYRGFTPDLDTFDNFNYKKHTMISKKSLYNFASGKGGILYKPEFFHKTDKLIFNSDIYLNSCDKQDDIWFYIIRVMNKIDCYIENNKEKWLKKCLNNGKGLYSNFNIKNNNNTIVFQKTIQKLKEYNYNINI